VNRLVDAVAAIAALAHQAGIPQDVEMPGYRRAADVEVINQLAHAVRALGEIRQQGPARRVRKPPGGVRTIGNRMVTYYGEQVPSSSQPHSTPGC
jgi:hypothetical protein